MPEEIYLMQHGEQVGPLSESEVRERIDTRRLQARTLTWFEGLDDWRPLASVLPFLVGEDPQAVNSDPRDPRTLRVLVASLGLSLLGALGLFLGPFGFLFRRTLAANVLGAHFFLGAPLGSDDAQKITAVAWISILAFVIGALLLVVGIGLALWHRSKSGIIANLATEPVPDHLDDPRPSTPSTGPVCAASGRSSSPP